MSLICECETCAPPPDDWYEDAPKDEVTCRNCHRPTSLHCPGCSTCDPDYTCPPTCDAEPEEVAAAAAAIEQWEAARPATEETR